MKKIITITAIVALFIFLVGCGANNATPGIVEVGSDLMEMPNFILISDSTSSDEDDNDAIQSEEYDLDYDHDEDFYSEENNEPLENVDIDSDYIETLDYMPYYHDSTPIEYDNSVIDPDVDDSGELDYGGWIDFFDLRFRERSGDIHYATVIKGDDIVEIWVEEVFLKLSDEEMDSIPVLYRIIRDLNISKHEFVALSNEFYAMSAYEMSFPPYMIDALFNDDIADMKSALVHPDAFFYNGEIYTWTQVRTALHQGTVSELNLPQYAFINFANERLADFNQIQDDWLIEQASFQSEYDEFRAYVYGVTMANANVFSADSEYAMIELAPFGFSIEREVNPNDWRFLFESDEAYFEFWRGHIEQTLSWNAHHLQEALDIIAMVSNMDF